MGKNSLSPGRCVYAWPYGLHTTCEVLLFELNSRGRAAGDNWQWSPVAQRACPGHREQRCQWRGSRGRDPRGACSARDAVWDQGLACSPANTLLIIPGGAVCCFQSRALPSTVSTNLPTNKRWRGTLHCRFETWRRATHVTSMLIIAKASFGEQITIPSLARGLVVLYRNNTIFCLDIWVVRKQSKSIIKQGPTLGSVWLS